MYLKVVHYISLGEKDNQARYSLLYVGLRLFFLVSRCNFNVRDRIGSLIKLSSAAFSIQDNFSQTKHYKSYKIRRRVYVVDEYY